MTEFEVLVNASDENQERFVEDVVSRVNSNLDLLAEEPQEFSQLVLAALYTPEGAELLAFMMGVRDVEEWVQELEEDLTSYADEEE